MAVPILRLNIDDNPRIIVKQDNIPVTVVYSGNTLVGSGATIVDNVSGNTWIVYSPTGTTGAITALVGSGGTWTGLLSGTTWIIYSPDWTADILGLTMSAQTAYECCTGNTADITYISGQTDYHYQQFTGFTDYVYTLIVPAITGNTADISYLSGQTEIAQQCCTGLTATFNDYTGDTFITLSGITVAGALLQAQTNNLQQAFTGHTGNTDIHFVMSAITITESQISDLGDYALQSDFTGHTSDLTIHYPQSGISITESQISDLQAYTLTGTTAALSDAFDSHTGDTSIHYPMSGISITESQISDLKTYLTGVTFNDITGDVSGNTNLQNALDLKLDNSVYQGDMLIIGGEIDNLTSGLTSHTGDTSIHYAQSAITITESQISDLQDYALESDLTGHTSDLTIHYQQSAITITESQVTNLVSDLAGKSDTGHTHAYSVITNTPDLSVYQPVSGMSAYTLTGTTQALSGAFDSHTGNTDIHFEKTDISYNDLQDLPSLFSGDYDDLTNKPDLSIYQPVSGMTAYLTGVTWNDVTNKPDLTLQSDFTGHTSDLTIHYPQSGISITESQISDLQAYTLQADFTGYTGTTDTTITGIENDILYLSGITSGNTADIQWLSGYTSGMTTTLSGCTDVTITTPADNDILKYSGSTWVNEAPLDLFANVDDLYMLRRSGSTVVGIPYSVMTGATGAQGASGITPTLTFNGGGGTSVTYSKVGAAYTIGITGATGASGLTPTLTFTGDSVVSTSVSGASYIIEVSAVTPTLIFSGVSGTTIDYTQSGATYYIDVQGEKGDTGDSGITPTFVFSGMSGTVVDYTQSGDTYYIEVTGVQGAPGSGATILISSGATICTYISGSTTGNTWNVYSPDYDYVTINSVTASTYTTVAGDCNEIIECASGCTGITLHSGATTGFQITFVSLGTQDITFSAQSGSTLRSKDSKTKLGNRYGAVTAYKNNTYWTLIGDIE